MPRFLPHVDENVGETRRPPGSARGLRVAGIDPAKHSGQIGRQRGAPGALGLGDVALDHEEPDAPAVHAAAVREVGRERDQIAAGAHGAVARQIDLGPGLLGVVTDQLDPNVRVARLLPREVGKRLLRSPGVIVKDYVKSRKHEWLDACFIPAADDEAGVQRVVGSFLRLREEVVGGLVFRMYVDLRPAGERVG